MCNIAGYVGDRRAAPILIEMMKREEGFDAGHYTGIATISEGRIHCAKVVGDVKRLLETTDAMDLPGNIGVIHGRTPGFGGRSWAHPFLSNDERIACVFNGSLGNYAGKQDREYVLERLKGGNVAFDSAEPDDGRSGFGIGDGRMAHTSEALTLFARYLMDEEGIPLHQALELETKRMPEEIVAVGIDREDPEAISFMRVGAPMNVGRSRTGVYLATSAIAFPDDVTEATSLPSESSGRITVDDTYIHRFEMPIPVEKVDPRTLPEMERALLDVVATEPQPLKFDVLARRIGWLYRPGQSHQAARIAYEIVRKWHLEGRLVLAPFTEKYGLFDEPGEIDVVQFGISLNET